MNEKILYFNTLNHSFYFYLFFLRYEFLLLFLKENGYEYLILKRLSNFFFNNKYTFYWKIFFKYIYLIFILYHLNNNCCLFKLFYQKKIKYHINF